MSINEKLLEQLTINFPATKGQIQSTYDELARLGFSHILALTITCALFNRGFNLDSLRDGWLSLISNPSELSEIHQMILNKEVQEVKNR